jgi:predicted nucleic acid-binding protein
MDRPRVFTDADVLFAAAASGSEHGASLIVLRLAELTLLELLTSQQVITEVERNLQKKMPKALPAFRLLCQKSVAVVRTPTPVECKAYQGEADPKDLPILVAALQARCPWLLTFNLRHYHPTSDKIAIVRPGTFVQEVRQLLTQL